MVEIIFYHLVTGRRHFCDFIFALLHRNPLSKTGLTVLTEYPPHERTSFCSYEYIRTMFVPVGLLYFFLSGLPKYMAAENVVLNIEQTHEINKLSESLHQGPVVQSVVSLTSSLRVISLSVLADSI